MTAYLPRVVDGELDALLPHLAALAIDGARGVGKTTTARQRARTELRLDESAVAATVAAEPGRITSSPRPTLVDEWQQVPETWDVVRRAVDDGAEPWSFILTGSATPAIGATVHSGAGRIVSVQMRPLSLAEREGATPTVSLAELLAGGTPAVGGESALDLARYVDHVTDSGFPAIRRLPARARRAQLDAYLAERLTRDLPEVGAVVRRPATLRAWLQAYAAATSTTASYREIDRAASPGDGDPPARSTSIRYRDWLTSLWLLDPVPAWTGLGRPLAALARAPKHHLVDPALAARLLNVSAGSLLDGEGRTLARSGPLVGALFESLATLHVRVLAQAAEARTSHLRTQRGEREVDLVVERHDGRVLAIEVKLSATVRDEDVRHLLWLRDKLGTRLSDAVVVTTGPTAYRRRDGVAVVPLGLLGP